MATVIGPDAFRAHLQTEFLVATPSGGVGLRLIGVTEQPAANGVRQFSLMLHGPPEMVLEQGTYELTHTELGSLAWFMVPVVGSNAERVIYQVCFTTFE